jgi:crotonobetainyl-CoA:carnitine CoA-transferase CaiB-like acyl-CoA transferase
MAITGEPGRAPVRVGIPLADMSGGIYACKGILAALYARSRTGRGQRIELSMFDCMLSLLGYVGTMWLTNGELPQPPGSGHDYTVPWQAFKAADGYIVVATREESFWRKLCEVLERPGLAADVRFATNADRCRNRAALVPQLEALFAERSVADWMARLRAAQVPAAPVNHLDAAFAEPPVAEHGMIAQYEHPDVGCVRVPGNPIRMSDAPATPSRPAPRLGEHTEEILRELLGLTRERIATLRAEGVIG